MGNKERITLWVLISGISIVAILGCILPPNDTSLIMLSWLISARFPLWLGTILIFLTGGSAGGIVAHIQKLDGAPIFGRLSLDDEVTRSLIVSATGGVGGAFAAMFIMVLDGKISKEHTPSLTDYTILAFISTSFVSGYLGFRFLKSVAERFEVLNAAKNEAKKVAEERVDQYLERSRAIEEALRQYENAPQEKDVVAAVVKMTEVHSRFSDDRHIAIKLARHHRQKGNLSGAITILKVTIEAIRDTGQSDAVSAKNIADLLYNRACYNCLLAGNETQDSRKAFYKKTAYTDLKESIRLSPENGPEAATDEDFKLLYGEGDFSTITKSETSMPRSSSVAEAPESTTATATTARTGDNPSASE